MPSRSDTVRTTRIFRNGNSQAVRIPADLSFDASEQDVEIERVGNELRIRPVRRKLDDALERFAQLGAALPADAFHDDWRDLDQDEREDV